jgi:hypothetical protein
MAWHKVLVTGLVASVAFVGCTVTTSPDGGDGSIFGKGGTDAGTTGTGGKATGGGGATSTGGKASTGGAGGAKSTGGSGNVDAGPPNDGDCTKCLKQYCLTEYNDCGKDPDCSQSATRDGEFIKLQQCMFDVTGDASVAVFTEADLATCAGDSAASGGVPSDKTQALSTCMRGEADASTQPCTERCFGATVPYVH